MKTYKRRTYYIKNSAQGKFIFRFVLTSFIGAILAVSAFNYLAYKKIDSVLYSMRMPKVSPGGLLWNEMMYTNIFVAVFILIVFAIAARGLYNRVHGPLVKLTRDIGKMADGDLQSGVTLRRNDEFRDFAEELDEMGRNLNERFRRISAMVDAVIVETDKLGRDPGGDEAVLAEVRQRVAALEDAIHTFKV